MQYFAVLQGRKSVDWSTLKCHRADVLRPTLSHANKTTKDCIQFLYEVGTLTERESL